MSLKDELRNATIGNTIVDGTVTWVVDAPIYTYQGADNSNKVFKVNTSGLAVPAYLTASDITSGVFSIDLIPNISKTKITDFAHTHEKSEITDFDHVHHADEIVYYVPEPPIDPETGEYEIDPETGETVAVEPPVFDLRLLPQIPFNKLADGVMDSEINSESTHPVQNRVIKAALDLKANDASLTAHTGNTSNPHSVTKSQVGLGSVVNTGDSDVPTSGGTTKFTTGGAYTELAKKQDKLTAGTNITISNNTISATDTTYSAATTSADGLMSATDKTKLDDIATGATKVQDNHSTTNGTILVNGSSVVVYDDADIRQQLAGFEKGYVINGESAITGTKNTTTGDWTNVTAITGITLSQLKIGDNVYLLDNTAPDFWVSQISPTVSLNVLDTKIDLSNYYNKNEVDSALAGKVPTSRTVDGKALSSDILVSRVLTKAQYNALSTAEKNNGTSYYVTDEDPDSSINIVQITGQSTTDVMSQKAITDELGAKQDKVVIVYA